MDPRGILFSAALTGVGVAVLWVAFWALIVPEVLPVLTWSGYEVLTTPLFVVGCFGGAVGRVLSNR